MTVHNEPPDSMFAYVVVASRRARQLMFGAPPLVIHPRSYKPTRVAMEELDKAVLEYRLPESPEGKDDKEEKRRRE